MPFAVVFLWLFLIPLPIIATYLAPGKKGDEVCYTASSSQKCLFIEGGLLLVVELFLPFPFRKLTSFNDINLSLIYLFRITLKTLRRFIVLPKKNKM
jgi:hypothetical protein